MDDLISRQAAIKAIEDLQDCYNGFSDTYDKACIIGVLEEVPSAQPERKKGKWITHEVKSFDGCHTGRYFDECSECGKLTTEWRKVTEYHRWNFCPNCGAKMEVEE